MAIAMTKLSVDANVRKPDFLLTQESLRTGMEMPPSKRFRSDPELD
jgi:hypothetical protein